MKRKKWYKYKNSETGHVIHSQVLPEDMTFGEGDTYYELVGRSRLSRNERKTLHVYKSGEFVAKSKTDGIDMDLSFEIFSQYGEYVDSVPMKLTRR